MSPADFPLFSCQVMGRGLHFSHILWHEQDQSECGPKPSTSKTSRKVLSNCRTLSRRLKIWGVRGFHTWRAREPELSCNSANVLNVPSATSPLNFKHIEITNSRPTPNRPPVSSENSLLHSKRRSWN